MDATRNTLCIEINEGKDAAGMGLSRIVAALFTILIKSLLVSWGRVAVFHLFGFSDRRIGISEGGCPTVNMMGVET